MPQNDLFKLTTDFKPSGDQPQAIATLLEGIRSGEKNQVLLGVTGSGKTFTAAHVIQALARPTLILAPNKTLAAQLYGEMLEFFPQNAVEYFVSYYDYYQPEAYVPRTDTYIEKDSSINEQIDRMRHSATRALLERRDCIVVASVSCIYGIGDVETYQGMAFALEKGFALDRQALIARLVELQYKRNDIDFSRGSFRVRGDIVELFPAHLDDRAWRFSFFGDELEKISEIDALTGRASGELDSVMVYANSHHVTPKPTMQQAIKEIKKDLHLRLDELRGQGKLLEEQRLAQRTSFDLEMLEATGMCPGIENYSRYLTGRKPGEPPPTLFEYLPDDALLIVDESHVMIPQLRGMYLGDRARKQTLSDYGFRLPACLDNRPLKFSEFEQCLNQVVHVSATPGTYELQHAEGDVIEQIVRPTGLMDPQIDVVPAKGQVDHLLGQVRAEVAKGGRVLITTLTKRMAEDLTEYYHDLGIKVRYLHSDIKTLERAEIVRDLRCGKFDVLVGINLLREGLDLPEVSLVAILDADKEGYLRSYRSLIQTAGRAARNLEGRVIFYGDGVTDSMKAAIDETTRRRRIQAEYNRVHGITPTGIKKSIPALEYAMADGDYVQLDLAAETSDTYGNGESPDQLIQRLELEMKAAAKELAFERAAELRNRIRSLRLQVLDMKS